MAATQNQPPGLRGLPNHPLMHLLTQTAIVLGLLTAGYYVLPRKIALSDPMFLLRTAVVAGALGLLVWLYRIQDRRSRRLQSAQFVRIERLLSVLYLLVLGFALLYTVVDQLDGSTFVGVTDRTSALYFSLTIVSTVGLGDVHPGNGLGQLLVSGQMLFDVVFLGTALRILTSAATPEFSLPDPPQRGDAAPESDPGPAVSAPPPTEPTDEQP